MSHREDTIIYIYIVISLWGYIIQLFPNCRGLIVGGNQFAATAQGQREGAGGQKKIVF